MANGPIRRKTEKAVRDRAGVPVGLLYDETNDQTIMHRGNDRGEAYVIGASKVCDCNSSNDNLDADAVFTGTAFDVNGYSTIIVTVYASHASATDGLSIQFSHDNDPYDWHESDAYTVGAGSYKTYTFQPVDQYFRLVYTNGGTQTTSLHINTRLHSNSVKSSSHRMADDISGQDDAELVKAILAAERPGTADVYTNIQATNGGNLKVAVEEFDTTAVLPQSQSYGYEEGTPSWTPIRQARTTEALLVQNYQHHEIEDGDHYFVTSYADLAINHVLDFTWQMPNTTKWIHWLWNLEVESETQWNIYEGASVVNPLANTVTPLNSNRNSANTSGTTMKYEDQATLAAANTDTDVSGATLIASGIIGAGRTAGETEAQNEIVLKQNTLYVLRAVATAAGYVNFDMH